MSRDTMLLIFSAVYVFAGLLYLHYHNGFEYITAAYVLMEIVRFSSAELRCSLVFLMLLYCERSWTLAISWTEWFRLYSRGPSRQSRFQGPVRAGSV